MKTMKLWRLAFAMLAAFSLASCSSDPEWADPEAHEKTVQLQEQYGPMLVGTWHFERIGERQRFFEQLTFEADGTLTGLRKWQMRSTVTVDGKETLTDWEDIPDDNGAFVGTWKFLWIRKNDTEGVNRLRLYASYKDGDYLFYNEDVTFGSVDAETLSMKSQFYGFLSGDEDGWINYQRGEAEPSFE
jgi:hypothetical protein